MGKSESTSKYSIRNLHDSAQKSHGWIVLKMLIAKNRTGDDFCIANAMMANCFSTIATKLLEQANGVCRKLGNIELQAIFVTEVMISMVTYDIGSLAV